MSPTSYRAAPSRDLTLAEEKGFEPLAPYNDLLQKNYEAPSTRLGYSSKNIKMAEEKGFEPLRRLHDLSVFKTDPFNRTWVFLHKNKLVPKVGLEPTRVLMLAGF